MNKTLQIKIAVNDLYDATLFLNHVFWYLVC